MRAIGDFIGREQARRSDDPDAGGVMTKQGWFSHEDLAHAGAWAHPDENGKRVIQFKSLDDQGRPYFRNIPTWKLPEGEQVVRAKE